MQLLTTTTQAELDAKSAMLQERVRAIDARLSETMCFLCAGSEGPLTCRGGVTLYKCGHAAHVGCEIRARNCTMRAVMQLLNPITLGPYEPVSEVVQGRRCGLCRCEFRGDDSVSLCELKFPAFKPRFLKDGREQIRRCGVMLDTQTANLDRACTMLDGTYVEAETDRPMRVDECLLM